MSLEKKVKDFAERARQILLAQVAADRENKEGKGTWQGYGADGRGQVKKDGETKPVNMIGEISLPTNADVFSDSTNSIEIQKATPKTAPNIPTPKVTTKIEPPITKSRPIAIDDFVRAARPNFIPFYVIRWNDSSFNSFTQNHPIPGPQFFSRQFVGGTEQTTYTDDRVTLDFRGRNANGNLDNSAPENTLLLHHTRYSQYYTEDEQRQFFMAARHYLNTSPTSPMNRTDPGSGTLGQPTSDRNVGAVNVGSDMTNIVFLMSHTWIPLYSNIGFQQPGGTGVPSNSPWSGDGAAAVLETHITEPAVGPPFSAQSVGFMIGHCILATDDFETWEMEINDGDSSQFGLINPIGNFRVSQFPFPNSLWMVQDAKSVTGPNAAVDHITSSNTFNSDYNNVNRVFTHTYP